MIGRQHDVKEPVLSGKEDISQNWGFNVSFPTSVTFARKYISTENKTRF